MSALRELLESLATDPAPDAPVRLTNHLDRLGPDDRRTDRAWFERGRAWFAQLGEDPDGPRVRHDMPWLEAICAIALLPPAAAARRVPWRRMWPGPDVAEVQHSFVARLADHDRDWVAGFGEVAGSTRLAAWPRSAGSGDVLSEALRTAVVRHGLPCPTGSTFLEAWQAGNRIVPLRHWEQSKDEEHEALGAALARDPLMPEILHHYLGSGHAGDEPRLPELLPELVAAGTVDRTAVLQTVLDALTQPPRVGTQRVLASCLTALEVTADDVPGGAAYLLGTLATAHGSVGAALLPAAIAAVATPDELHELATVIGSRPERQQKRVLLRALDDAMAARIGRDATVLALGTLADGNSDTAFAEDVRRALTALGADDTADGGNPVLGLWDVRPEITREELYLPKPSGPRYASSWPDGEGEVIASVLTILAADPGQAPGVAAWLDNLLTSRSISIGHAARMFETLFLGGGLRLLWDPVVVLTDKLTGEPSRPRGLEQLVRLLAAHAHEAPPRTIADLAHLRAVAGTGGSRGASKLAVEARALLLALSRAEELPDASTSAPAAQATRGLWDRPPAQASRAHPVSRLTPFRERDLGRLRERLVTDGTEREHTARALLPPAGLIGGSDLLACVADAIDHHGPESVAAALAGIDRTIPAPWGGERWSRPPGPVGQAIDLWAGGRLRAAMYRDLAHGPGTPEDLAELRHAPGRASILVFLHAAETLLRASDGGAAVLSTPTHSSGTLELPTLLARMDDALDAGPLDLMLALLRLEPYDGPPVVVPELSFRPDLAPSSERASDLVERWLAAGGLPAPVARLEDSRWQLDWRPPVPWTEFALAAADGPTGPSPSPRGTYDPVWRARICPRWPDVVPHAAHEQETDLRAVLALNGPLGTPSILLLLNMLIRDRGEPFWQPGETDHDVVVDALVTGRITSDAAAAAAVEGWTNSAFSLPEGLPHWRRLFEGGAMAAFWPVALAIADAGTAQARKPRGLADLLRLLADLAPEVPTAHRAVPEGIALLAAQAGRTRSHDEARRLVTVLGQVGA